MNVARMNHACIKYRENNKNKVMVVGGVTASVDDEFSVVRTMEILDINSMTWRQGLEVPDSVTGTNLILIDGRPALVGRYGDEQQRKILRYTDRGRAIYTCECCLNCSNLRFVGEYPSGSAGWSQ